MMCAHIHISVPSRRQRSSQGLGSQGLGSQGVGSQQPVTKSAQLVGRGSGNSITPPAGATIPPLSQVLERYPLAYDHGLLPQFSSTQLRPRQAQVRKSWEVSIYHVVTDYQLRQQRAQMGQIGEPTPLFNPTLLDAGQLQNTLEFLMASLAGPQNLRALAQQFRHRLPSLGNYASFKQALYHYLKLPEATCSGAKRLNQQLERGISGLLTEYDEAPLSDWLVLRSCTQLLSYWIVESHHQPDHTRFLNLLTQLGPVATVTWLLRIILLCPNAQGHLEKRLAILLGHYGDTPWLEVQWLVNTLEVLSVVGVLYLSGAQLPLFRSNPSPREEV